MKRTRAALLTAVLGAALLGGHIGAQVLPPAPPSLKTVPVPEPTNLALFVRNNTAAIALGKAFFWDMQVGSDGIQACASCHFHAGADDRTKNQLNPGTAHAATTFEVAPPNHTLVPSDFPLHRLADPASRFSSVLFDSDDVVSSQGMFRTKFVDIVPGRAQEMCSSVPDPIWNIGGTNVRRVASRNAPTVINAIFNFRNLWNGRGNAVFNGVSTFGARDAAARVLEVQLDGSVVPVPIAIDHGSVASVAVGPPVSSDLMSCAGRTWPKIGKKLLGLTPLGRQLVDPRDSVLGTLANSANTPGAPGLQVSYATLIRDAFQPQWWNSTKVVSFPAGGLTISDPTGAPLTTDQFTVMEANFPLFFGLAVQLYQATLVSDDSPFDRFMDGGGEGGANTNALTPQQKLGLAVFTNVGLNPTVGAGGCIACHAAHRRASSAAMHRADGDGAARGAARARLRHQPGRPRAGDAAARLRSSGRGDRDPAGHRTRRPGRLLRRTPRRAGHVRGRAHPARAHPEPRAGARPAPFCDRRAHRRPGLYRALRGRHPDGADGRLPRPRRGHPARRHHRRARRLL